MVTVLFILITMIVLFAIALPLLIVFGVLSAVVSLVRRHPSAAATRAPSVRAGRVVDRRAVPALRVRRCGGVATTGLWAPTTGTPAGRCSDDRSLGAGDAYPGLGPGVATLEAPTVTSWTRYFVYTPCGSSSSRMRRSSSVVGAGVVATTSVTSGSHPIASRTCSIVAPGCSESSRISPVASSKW